MKLIVFLSPILFFVTGYKSLNASIAQKTRPKDLNGALQVSSDSKEVYMCGNAEIALAAGEDKRKTIFTKSLEGCVALAFIVETSSGQKNVMMSHQWPIDLNEQLQELQKVYNRFKFRQDGSIVQKELIVLVPGEWSQDDQGKYVLIPKERFLSYIENLGKIVNEVKPIVSCYPLDNEHTNNYAPDFEVILTKDQITWWSKGDGYIVHKSFE